MLAILAQAALAGAAFAPPVNTPIRISLSETRTLNGVTRRGAVERIVRLHRRGDGYLAEVTTEAPALTGFNLAAADVAAFADIVVRIELDASGQVTAVADAPALWTRYVERMQALSGPAATAALQKLPVTRREAMVAQMVAPLAAGDVARAGVQPTRPISFTAQAPDGTAVTLTGEERTDRDGAGGFVRIRRASGAVTGGGTMTIHWERRVDPVTGMARQVRRRTTVTLPTGTSVNENVVTITAG